VSLSERDLVIPDAVLCSAATLSRVGSALAVDVPPDLVVEVPSPSTRRYDLITKRAHYERIGVAEYWFVDLDADHAEVHRLVDGRYGPPALAGWGGELRPPHLPGLVVVVDDVLAEPRSG
jgi:Uma2 family endonuclease